MPSKKKNPTGNVLQMPRKKFSFSCLFTLLKPIEFIRYIVQYRFVAIANTYTPLGSKLFFDPIWFGCLFKCSIILLNFYIYCYIFIHSFSISLFLSNSICTFINLSCVSIFQLLRNRSTFGISTLYDEPNRILYVG